MAAALIALATAPLSASAATSNIIDFTSSGYTVGYQSPKGQNGWWQAQSVDYSLVDNSSFAASGLPGSGRSLQFSNSTQLGGGAHLVSPMVDAAGEPATGAAYNTFETTFTVASATGTVQPGLGVDVALDDSRFGGVVSLRHSSDKLVIGSYWYPAGAVDLTPPSWRSAIFTSVDPTVAHVIRLVAIFIEDKPDTLDVYVDGTLVSAGSGATTWEAYSGSNGTPTVDSISFKASSSAPTADGIGYTSGLPSAPATQGKGLLFSGISYGASMTVPQPPVVTPPVVTPPVVTAPTTPSKPAAPTPDPTAEPTESETPEVTLDSVIETFGADTAALLEAYLLETGREVPPDLEELFTVDGEIDLSDFTAWLSWTGDETVQLYGYSTPTYLGTFPVVNGRAEISGVDLTVLGEGEHHLLVVGEQSGASQLVQLEVPASEPTESQPPAATPAAAGDEAGSTGLPIWLIPLIAAIAIMAIIAIVLLVRRRTA